MISGIYCITNVVNGKSYVGQSIDISRRLTAHYKMAGHQSALYSAMRKYGPENFICNILEKCDMESLNAAESWWMQELGSVSPNGYNLIAEGEHGRRVCEATKDKISSALKGKTPAVNSMPRRAEWEEARLRELRKALSIRGSRTGTKCSDAQKALISARHLGAKRSPETRSRISASLTGKPFSAERLLTVRRKKVLRSDGVIYDSIIAAAMDSGVQRANITKVLRGERTHTGGFGWTWINQQIEASK